MSPTTTTRSTPWPNQCPRCHQTTEVLPTSGRMKPHRDLTVNAPCPMKGKTVREAVDIVNAERARLGLAPVVR